MSVICLCVTKTVSSESQWALCSEGKHLMPLCMSEKRKKSRCCQFHFLPRFLNNRTVEPLSNLHLEKNSHMSSHGKIHYNCLDSWPTHKGWRRVESCNTTPYLIRLFIKSLLNIFFPRNEICIVTEGHDLWINRIPLLRTNYFLIRPVS